MKSTSEMFFNFIYLYILYGEIINKEEVETISISRKVLVIKQIEGKKKAVISSQTCDSPPYQQTQSNMYLMLFGEKGMQK